MDSEQQILINNLIQKIQLRVFDPRFQEAIARQAIATQMFAERLAVPLITDHALASRDIMDDEGRTRLQLSLQARSGHIIASIQQCIRLPSQLAAHGPLALADRNNANLIKNLTSYNYIPRLQDLALLNQMAFFLNPDPRNQCIIKNKIAELIPLQLRDLVVDITGSNDLTDFLSNQMIFVSANQLICICMSYGYFAKFILGDLNPIYTDIEWSQIYVIRKLEDAPYVAVPVRDLREIFHSFPLFAEPYRVSSQSRIHQYMFGIFRTNGLVWPAISATLNSPSSSLKLVNSAEERALSEYLTVFFVPGSITDENTFLTPQALERIFQSFEYTDRSQADKNFLILAVALFFVTLSSSRFLGTEEASPFALRLFAVALLNSISAEAPFFAEIQDWRNRLLGLSGAYTCTDILQTMMSETLQTLRPEIVTLVYPDAWR